MATRQYNKRSAVQQQTYVYKSIPRTLLIQPSPPHHIPSVMPHRNRRPLVRQPAPPLLPPPQKRLPPVLRLVPRQEPKLPLPLQPRVPLHRVPRSAAHLRRQEGRVRRDGGLGHEVGGPGGGGGGRGREGRGAGEGCGGEGRAEGRKGGEGPELSLADCRRVVWGGTGRGRGGCLPGGEARREGREGRARRRRGEADEGLAQHYFERPECVLQPSCWRDGGRAWWVGDSRVVLGSSETDEVDVRREILQERLLWQVVATVNLLPSAIHHLSPRRSLSPGAKLDATREVLVNTQDIGSQ